MRADPHPTRKPICNLTLDLLLNLKLTLTLTFFSLTPTLNPNPDGWQVVHEEPRG